MGEEVMKLKFINKDGNKVTLIMVATLEYTEGEKTIVIWDYTGDKVTIDCGSIEDAETCVFNLWDMGCFELDKVNVFWG